MSVPPPLPDPSHIETRLLVVAEMLEKAVTEVRRAMAEIKGETFSFETTTTEITHQVKPQPGSTDVH